MDFVEELVLDLLTEGDVAKQLHVSVASLRRWRLLQRGPQFVKVGALVRYRPVDLEEWLGASRPAELARSAGILDSKQLYARHDKRKSRASGHRFFVTAVGFPTETARRARIRPVGLPSLAHPNHVAGFFRLRGFEWFL